LQNEATFSFVQVQAVLFASQRVDLPVNCALIIPDPSAFRKSMVAPNGGRFVICQLSCPRRSYMVQKDRGHFMVKNRNEVHSDEACSQYGCI